MTDLETLTRQLRDINYIASQELVVSLWLMSQLGRPLLLEGDAGVGKTEVGKALSQIYDRPLIRLQCYEGLDVNTAVYEWNYQRQLLEIYRTGEAVKASSNNSQSALNEGDLFSQKYLLERPLLSSIRQEQPPVLIIDEIDRADEEFEAYLLEVLSDFQISIPELGTIEAKSIPMVILTSNGTRELSDALRRRSLYHYIDYPDHAKELSIVMAKAPEVGAKLASQVVNFIQQIRSEDLRKKPGIAETLDWVAALSRLKIDSLDENPEAVLQTLGCLLKTREDHQAMPADVIERYVAKSL